MVLHCVFHLKTSCNRKLKSILRRQINIAPEKEIFFLIQSAFEVGSRSGRHTLEDGG